MKINCKGFTLIELFIVVAILGVLATIAISMAVSIVDKGRVATIKSDLNSAYKASVAVHIESPEDIVNIDILKENGYNQSKPIEITVVDGSMETLKITAKHINSAVIYKIDSSGKIQKQ